MNLRSQFSPIIPLREKIGNYDIIIVKCLNIFIIPLREKIGNYDYDDHPDLYDHIIPLREKIGNYDKFSPVIPSRLIIPLREKIGNYDRFSNDSIRFFNYTTTRENWELRPAGLNPVLSANYTTTRENWELRLMLLNLTRIVESVLASSEDSVEQELRRLELEFEKLQMD